MINSKKFILLQENKKNTLIVQQESRVFYPPHPTFFSQKKKVGYRCASSTYTPWLSCSLSREILISWNCFRRQRQVSFREEGEKHQMNGQSSTFNVCVFDQFSFFLFYFFQWQFWCWLGFSVCFFQFIHRIYQWVHLHISSLLFV